MSEFWTWACSLAVPNGKEHFLRTSFHVSDGADIAVRPRFTLPGRSGVRANLQGRGTAHDQKQPFWTSCEMSRFSLEMAC